MFSVLLAVALAVAQEPLHIGFVDPRLQVGAEGAEGLPRHAAAAFAFALERGRVTRLKPLPDGGWQGPDGRIWAPEEFDVLWFHEGDDPNVAALSRGAVQDLLAYLDGGGAVLLSGAAGRLVAELGVEPTSPRVLGVSDWAYVSGIIVTEGQRSHPAFEGLDVTQPVLLTSFGGAALADFYGTPGPHGVLLADGNAGLGERPLVEYRVGAGRAIFVGWRLPDFTTAGDAYRPNLERLFSNLLHYLAGANSNRARLARPDGPSRYSRVLGVPFLQAEAPTLLEATWAGARAAVVLGAGPGEATDFPVGGLHVAEQPASAEPVTATALALTLLDRERPVSRYVAARQAEQEEADRRDRELIGSRTVLQPAVQFTPGPLRPLRNPDVEQAVLLGRSPFMAPGDGLGDITPVYEPVEDGGFRISGSRRQLNRPIVIGQNRVWTGDVPLFRMDTTTGNGCYSADRVYPLWPRPDAAAGGAYPCMGTLRLAVPGADGAPRWLDEAPQVTALFRPGYTEYDVADQGAGWRVHLAVAPSLGGHGLVCRVDFDRDTPLLWQYGGLWWQPSEEAGNRVELRDGLAVLTAESLPNGVAIAGWDGEGEMTVVAGPHGDKVRVAASEPRRTYHIVATWGVTAHDEERAQATMARLDTEAAAGWPEARDRLKRLWYDCYVRPALEPEARCRELLREPATALAATQQWWDARRAEFQIRTPDPYLNALINWNRCISEYHRQGPGLVLGAQYWVMYSHISTGWYGKQWGGDHQAVEECLRLYGAMQADDGYVRWVSPSLTPFNAENNTPYWVDQVWWHYAWTGDTQFVRDLWPLVRKAVDWQRRNNDPDGDGLFRDFYEYWNCDSNGKGPKAVAPSAMSWAMLDRAARMAAVVGDAAAEAEYRALADRTREAVMRELWREDRGRLGSIGSDGLWRGHPQTWEEYLAINAGLLSPEQGRRAMRWLEAHYGYEPRPGVKLLPNSDWFPIRWSCQWVPTGDTCLAALAGMRCGDADLWWPYLRTVVGSAFRSDFPGINMGISNAGAGGGDREDVDSDDPHTHVVVRGLFGIEPALHEGRLDICPAFPSDWQEASITTPDVSYDYRREGNQATFHIRTPRPTVKRVRANLTGAEVVTPAEAESTVTVPVGPAIEPPAPSPCPPILKEQTEAQRLAPTPLTDTERARLVLLDLSGAYNQTQEEMVATPFLFDYADTPAPLTSWWGNPALSLAPTPRVVQTDSGVTFLTTGRPRWQTDGPPKGLIALSSWPPHALPAAVTISVGRPCERLWLLLQSYVHPIKNYLPNGEVVLHYLGGEPAITSLIPPFNLDCYFQHFSLEGEPVPLGQLGPGAFIHSGMCFAHADALAVPCDPTRVLESVELRATCSEGVLGLVGVTLLTAP